MIIIQQHLEIISSPTRCKKTLGDDDNNNTNRHHHAIISFRAQIILLVSLLAGFTILAARPFGFRTFLSSMEHGGLYPIPIIFGIIAIILVLTQRLEIIFIESSKDNGYTQ
jgi:hypothetical protein